MTIERGQSWGEPAVDVGDVPVAEDDAELARMVGRARAEGTHLQVSVRSGDLAATLGLGNDGTDSAGGREPYAYPMDLGLARLGSGPDASEGVEPVPFVAHATVRAKSRIGVWLGHGSGISVAVMNAAWLGDLRLGPRAHPNDGLLDITVGRVPFGQRREANRRARSGSHLPHPDLTTHRRPSWEIDFSSSKEIWLDGVHRGSFDRFGVEVVPDAFTVIA